MKPFLTWMSRHCFGSGLLVGLLIHSGIGCAGHEGLPAGTSFPAPASVPIQVQHVSTSSPSPSSTSLGHVTAIAVYSREIPPRRDLDRWLLSLVEQGVTMLICETGTGSESHLGSSANGHREAGVYFRSEWAPTVRDILGELVPSAHQHGLAVFAAFSPRRIDWIESSLGWNDRVYDPIGKQVRLSSAMDLFHPAFQEYLVGLLTDLAATDIDGLLFQNDSPLGPFDGLSSFALQGVEKEFQTRIDPLHLFQGLPSADGAVGLSAAGKAQYPPEFWRWAGWKARERIKVLERLGRAMRLRAHNLQLAVDIHPEAVMDPRAALVLYSEDLLEAKRRFRYFVLRPESAPHSDIAEPPLVNLLEQMKGLLGQDKDIWVRMPQGISTYTRMSNFSHLGQPGVPDSIGLIYTHK